MSPEEIRTAVEAALSAWLKGTGPLWRILLMMSVVGLGACLGSSRREQAKNVADVGVYVATSLPAPNLPTSPWSSSRREPLVVDVLTHPALAQAQASALAQAKAFERLKDAIAQVALHGQEVHGARLQLELAQAELNEATTRYHEAQALLAGTLREVRQLCGEPSNL